MDVNLKGPFQLIQKVGRVMIAQGGGSIVNVSSRAAIYGSPGEYIHYAASKGALMLVPPFLAMKSRPTMVAAPKPRKVVMM